jgi:hypothetical protein
MSDTKRNRAIIERVAAGTSIKAVADEFGITKQRVSQIHVRLTGERQPKPDPWPACSHRQAKGHVRSARGGSSPRRWRASQCLFQCAPGGIGRPLGGGPGTEGFASIERRLSVPARSSR